MLAAMYLPEMPDSPHVFHAEAALPLRYEDVCQDGRMVPIGMPHALTSVLRACVREHSLASARALGIVPILAQIWIRGRDERVHVGKPARSVGTGVFAHVRGDSGEVERVVLDMRATIYATEGHVLDPKPKADESEVIVGEVFARHVLTKLFAPAGQRRVREVAIAGMEAPTEVKWLSPSDMFAPPEDATWLDGEATVSPHRPRFGLQHTDSNQHVNSLVYPRLFEEAALGRFDEHGIEEQPLARNVAINFRRPFFAGQRCEMQIQAYSREAVQGCMGTFVGPENKVHCDVQMEFS